MQDFFALSNRKQKLKLQAYLLDIRQRVEQDLLRIPGVLHIGVALKDKQGKPTGIPSLRVYVKEKLPLVALATEYHIPHTIQGVMTDVVKLSSYELDLPDTQKYRPVVAGAQIINNKWKLGPPPDNTPDSLAGSLGCFAKDANDKIGFISNEHVMGYAGAQVGDLIGQPSSPCESLCIKCGVVGTISVLVNDHSTVDCGFAILDEKVSHSNSIPQIGYIRGTATAVLQEDIRKYGRSTGYTEGKVVDISGPASTGGHTYQDQVIVSTDGSAVTGAPLSDLGDSGCVYVNSDNKVVALHFAHSSTTSAGNQIANVETELGVTVLASSAPAAVAPLGGYSLPPTKAKPQFWEEIEAWEQQFFNPEKRNELGFHPMEIRKEITHLIRHNRAIKVAWSRYQGPSFVGHIKKAADDPDYQVPQEIQGISWKQLMIKMIDLMETYGSLDLRTFIDAYAVELLELEPKPSHFKQFLTQIDSPNSEAVMSPKN